MKALAQFVVGVTNLFEAEFRSAKRNTVRIAVAVIVYLAAMFVLVAALLAWEVALFLALLEKMHPAWSIFIVGATMFLVGLCCIFTGRYVLRDRRRQ